MWKRMVAPAAVVSVLWIAVSGLTTYFLSSMLESHSRTRSEDFTTIEAAWGMRRDAWRLQVVLLEAAHEDPAQSQLERQSLEQTFLAALEEADRTSFTPPERELVKAIRQQFDAYRADLDRIMKFQNGPNGQLPSAEDRERNLRLVTAVTESCRRLIEINQRLIEAQMAANQRLYFSVVTMRVAFLILGPLAGIAVGIWIARRLNRSISEISVTLKDASGKLGANLGSVAVSVSDELPELQRQVRIVGDQIQQVMDKLEDARRRAVQSERLAAVGELAAGVAHEIRNPLTSVKLLIQTAAERQPEPQMSPDHFQILLQEVSRMEATIQGLLDFARPPALRSISHDIRQTVRRALNLVHGRASKSRIAVIEQMPDAPVPVEGDPDQLSLVLVNLMLNAVEAMEKTGGTLSVSVVREDGKCRIRVADTGPGIPPQILDRIFEPFVTGKERGTGLGLAISRRVVDEHRGRLLAVNPPGGGAELTIELSLNQNGKPLSAAASPEESHAETARH